ncbi:MAG: fibrobacter succinogenes major paralogous domain-containing protein [Bacteroidales bacterium]|nr:fibrobacter succinogenes major paralogous domain-containing protein [Bacteroidales bacterium]
MSNSINIYRKVVFTAFIYFIICSMIWAQAPQKFYHQEVIRNNSNQLVTNSTVGIRVSILEGSPNGTLVYSETQNALSNADGLVSIEIGNGTGFNTINWANSSFYYLKTETDPSGGTNYSGTETTQILSVPYALYANTAAVTSGYDELIARNLALKDLLIEAGIFLVKDIEGNKYKTVKIGEQLWMAENLKTTKLNDGTAIPLVTDDTQWGNLTIPGYCWYDNNSTFKDIYGTLYNWQTVNTGKLCPAGWHVPTDTEWTTLEEYLISNGYNYDGSTTGNKIAKSLGTDTYWNNSTIAGAVGNTDYPDKRNASGFSALPSGKRLGAGRFLSMAELCAWWCATEHNETTAWFRYMNYYQSYVTRNYNFKNAGFSIRCVMD